MKRVISNPVFHFDNEYERKDFQEILDAQSIVNGVFYTENSEVCEVYKTFQMEQLEHIFDEMNTLSTYRDDMIDAEESMNEAKRMMQIHINDDNAINMLADVAKIFVQSYNVYVEAKQFYNDKLDSLKNEKW